MMITRKESMSNTRCCLTINSAPKNGNVNPTYDFDIAKRVRYKKN